MLKVIDIALKDLTRSLRSATALAFMFGIPLLVTGMFYLMFGSSASQGEFNLPRTKLVIANLDLDAPRLQASSGSVPGGIRANTLSGLVVNILRSDKLSDLLEVTLVRDAAAARNAVDRQQAQVAIIIPEGFSRQFADPYGQAQIEFYQDPTLTIGPGIVRSILSQFMDGLAGVKIVVDVAMDQLDPSEYGQISQIVQQYMDASPIHGEDLAASLLDERMADKPGDVSRQNANSVVRILGPIMGGMMVFFAFITGTSSAESLLREQEEGTLPRLFTTPTLQTTILEGKFLAVFLTVLVQIGAMFLAGRLIFRIDWGALGSVTIVAAGIVLVAASFGIFINSLLRDTKQGGVVFGGVLSFTGMIGMVRVFAMSASGTANLGNTVSLLVPQGWAIRGILMLLDGTTGTPLLLNSLVMLVWSAVFFIIGVWRFNKRYR
jgi:ABC-type transport system involved in multi-copper enzyme maturation permease subunit